MAHGCFPDWEFANYKWHALKSTITGLYEIAEWVPDNAPTKPVSDPIWIRWGNTGDFAILCQCEYVGPAHPLAFI